MRHRQKFLDVPPNKTNTPCPSWTQIGKTNSPVRRSAATRMQSPRFLRVRVFTQARFSTKTGFRHSPHHQYLRLMLQMATSLY